MINKKFRLLILIVHVFLSYSKANSFVYYFELLLLRHGRLDLAYAYVLIFSSLFNSIIRLVDQSNLFKGIFLVLDPLKSLKVACIEDKRLKVFEIASC